MDSSSNTEVNEAAPAGLAAGQLGLDDLVALAEVMEEILGHALSPGQSSDLKRAYYLARQSAEGATLGAIAAAARAL